MRSPLVMMNQISKKMKKKSFLSQGYDGFEDLRKFIKQGSEFSKEVASMLQERADMESTYAKGLNKLAAKLLKAVQTSVGSLGEGWKAVGMAMEQEAELHKNLAAGLLDEMSKPLKGLIEAQVKARKPIEVAVDKSYKSLQERRADELKSKKQSYMCRKELEKAEDGISTSKTKDVPKLEKRSKHLLTSSKKADKEYTEHCYKAESARQDWDFTVAKAGSQLQQLEEERLRGMEEYLNKYNSHISVLAPKLTQAHNRLNEAVISVDLQQDVHTVITQKGLKETRQAEQILVDCYAEDTQFSMNMERRKETLKNFLIYIHQYIEKEKKAKEGVQKLVEVYKNKPNFADPEAQEETRQRLHHTMLMLNFLEVSHFKINSCLCRLESRTLPRHPFEQNISSSRDKQGYVLSVLKLPLHIALDDTVDYSNYSPPTDYYMELATAEDESDEFDDLPSPVGKCEALYDYDANEADELSIKKGDVIVVYEKLADGWWTGELNGHSGIFPSTYVQDLP
ncbi:nostrin-like isoform X2 [Babylonia areolata]|uniref:nostrin-like isoform X2 n=1 Tax=Babylonia areolata TaxID=304850 RepID=UPI003FD2F4B1